jgi:hypothetical protein
VLVQDHDEPRTPHLFASDTLGTNRQAHLCLHLVLHSRQPDDLAPIFTMKLAQKYESKKDLKAMQAVAKALKDRSLEAFEKNLKDYTSGKPGARGSSPILLVG